MSDVGLVAEARKLLADAGLTGAFLVRDLLTGEEIGIDEDTVFPILSIVKVPLAVAVLEHIADGRLDGGAYIEVRPGIEAAAAPIGLSRFRHSASIAVDDLLYLSTSISDNVAAEALFGLVPPTSVNRSVLAAGISGLTVRHGITQSVSTPAERLGCDEIHLAQALAIGSVTLGRGHVVPQLDVSRANCGSARALVNFLEALWLPSPIAADIAERVRALLAANVITHRLAPDFSSDGSMWSSKTGTLLNLRHEIGVVEHDDGAILAVAALTESSVPAAVQPTAEATMAHVARMLHDRIRLA